MSLLKIKYKFLGEEDNDKAIEMNKIKYIIYL